MVAPDIHAVYPVIQGKGKMTQYPVFICFANVPILSAMSHFGRRSDKQTHL